MLPRALALLLLLCGAGAAHGDVVVAIRYFQKERTSHAHLYLFTDDGQLLRQLTSAKEGQDRDPVFAPDGKAIAFLRDEEWWILQQDGSGEQRLTSRLDWPKAEQPAAFDYPPSVNDPKEAGEQILDEGARAGEMRFAAPDGSASLILRDPPPPPALGSEGYFPKAAFLKDEKTGKEQAFERLPVTRFRQTGNPEETKMRAPGHLLISQELPLRFEDRLYSYRLDRNGSPFLVVAPLRVVFFAQHRGSTDGAGFFAANLNENR